MENNVADDKAYLYEILKKYDYICAIYISDNDGSIIASVKQPKPKEEDNIDDKINVPLTYDFSIFLEQISKTEKWKTKNLITFFAKHTIFQSKFNNSLFCHIICKNEDYSHETVKNIVKGIQKRLDKVIDKIEKIRKE